jgi:hypothetical protein
MKKEKMQIYVTKRQYDFLEDEAKSLEITTSELMRRLLNDWIKLRLKELNGE